MVNERLLPMQREHTPECMQHAMRNKRAMATLKELVKYKQVDELLAKGDSWKEELIRSEITALNLAITALGKQIPKHVIWQDGNVPQCPTCGGWNTTMVCECGQLLDWGSPDDEDTEDDMEETDINIIDAEKINIIEVEGLEEDDE